MGVCEQCGGPLTGTGRSDRKYCGRACQQKAHRARLKTAKQEAAAAALSAAPPEPAERAGVRAVEGEAETLRALRAALAAQLDAGAEPRDAVALSKELREIEKRLADLAAPTAREGGAADELAARRARAAGAAGAVAADGGRAARSR